MANDNDDAIDVPVVSKGETLPPNMMMLKMENESMMAAAVMRPRSPAKIIKQLTELIEAFPKSADDAIYSKPVGKVRRIECGDCGHTYEVPANRSKLECTKCGSQKAKSQSRPIMKYAEGLSIRAAETIRAIYGYTRLATTTEILPTGNAKITGIFVDYAAGNITSDEREVSCFYEKFGGGRERIAVDRFLGLTVKAEKSKLRRDVILDCVPNEVKAAYVDACEKKLAQMVTPELVEKEIIPWFLARGITREDLELLVGRPIALGWTEEDRLRLKTIANGLKNEEVTVAELLADIRDEGGNKGGGKVGRSDVTDKFKDKKPADAEKPKDADEGKKPAEGSASQGTNTDVRAPEGEQPAVEIPMEWEAKLNEIETAEHCEKAIEQLNADTTLADEPRQHIYEILLGKQRKLKKSSAKAKQKELGE